MYIYIYIYREREKYENKTSVHVPPIGNTALYAAKN